MLLILSECGISLKQQLGGAGEYTPVMTFFALIYINLTVIMVPFCYSSYTSGISMNKNGHITLELKDILSSVIMREQALFLHVYESDDTEEGHYEQER